MSDIDIVRQVYTKNTIWYKIYYISIGVIILGIISILSGPVVTLEKTVINKDGIDIMLVLDMSYSMIAEDIKPRRIDAAKTMLRNFVSGIYSDRVGAILVSGKPFQSVPMTYDYEFLDNFIESVSVDIVAQSTNPELAGTALGDGLVLASDVLTRDNPEREKVIILITDGEANKGIKPELALRLLKQKGIKTYTIGVGKGEETDIRVQIGNLYQQIRVSGVDEEILKAISRETGGEYFKADSSESFFNVGETISRLEKTPLSYEVYESKNSLSLYIILIILLSTGSLVYIHFFKKLSL